MAAFDFEHWKFGFASDFGIRISNFPGAALGSGSAGLGVRHQLGGAAGSPVRDPQNPARAKKTLGERVSGMFPTATGEFQPRLAHQPP